MARHWNVRCGDGIVFAEVRQHRAACSLIVDATKDANNIWWALMQTTLHQDFDMNQLQQHGHELRISARVRPSHAPRRVNMRIRAALQCDDGSHLKEYDLDSTGWHVISLTTRQFRPSLGDAVIGHIAMMDWGRQKYSLDVEDFQVEVVASSGVSQDCGDPIPYSPPPLSPELFSTHLTVAHDAMISSRYPGVNLSDWAVYPHAGCRILTVAPDLEVVLRWELPERGDKRIAGPGLLEIPFIFLQTLSRPPKDLCRIRAVELYAIYDGWNRNTVTYGRIVQTSPRDEVINPQMIVDTRVGDDFYTGMHRVPVPRCVLQRMVNGKTTGIVLQALGPIVACLTGTDPHHGIGTMLHYNTV